MNRRITSVVGGVAALGLAALAVPGLAQAAPSITDVPAAKAEAKTKSDNFPDALANKRNALREKALDQLAAGKAHTVGKGKNRTIKMADGTEIDYPVTQTAQLLTFLVDFGDGSGNTAFPDNTAGPVHNSIPEPDRATDNTTYWESDFSREHYMEMFFSGLQDQGGESFHDVYAKMSSGRFNLQGDVSDWVTVPHPESFYQSSTGDEDGTSMKNFIGDSATAWYDAQVAAGKTDQEIKDYLAQFDQWDRYDYDHDGNYNEPDGYIDHFQAIHAGEGEEAGAPPWAIWSHRWAVAPSSPVGPDGNQAGGVQIGNTGFWIRDYTTEPENGGLGVFAHEFGHDLGLPDYYDTQGGDNGTAFWNLMSSGSWLNHGGDTIGTSAGEMGATEKLFLGWYGNDDLAVVDGTGAPQKVTLGPSHHATNTGKQALLVNLPQGHATVDVVQPEGPGTHYLYSGNGDYRRAYATSPSVAITADNAQLSARVSYSIEDDWDYAYLQASDDNGATWTNVETSKSTTTNPNEQNEGFGITGCSGTRDATSGECDNAWTDLTADLSSYVGKDVQLRWQMFNDAGYHELGFSVDNIKLGATTFADFETGADAWTLDKFRLMDGASYGIDYDQYYLAENRQYQSYDKTLQEGPYSFDYSVTAPNKVDRFPYQDGLLVWYKSTLCGDNNTSSHPGCGQALPVDANPTYELWRLQDGTPAAWANGRLNSYDSTFDVDKTDALHLANEANGGMQYDVPAQQSVPVFDDSDVNGYWDDSWSRSGWYSTKVAGVGAMIQVLSSNENTGQMVVKAGHRFVAPTSAAKVTGTPRVGQTLTAHAPAYFQDGVTPAYQWKVGSKSVATGSTYQVRPADSGKTVTVVVTGTKDGYGDDVSTSAPTGKILPAAVKLGVKGPHKVKMGKAARLTVTVGSAGTTPTGKVQVRFGGKTVTKSLRGGKATFRLAKQHKAHAMKAVVKYLPGTGFSRASKTVTIRIVK